MRDPVARTIAEPSQVGEARRVAAAMAQALGFDEPSRGRVALVVTEAATNLLKHAGGGELIAQSVGRGDGAALEVLALDKGPGMADVSRCLADGYSTAGSSGNGLGAIRRLSSTFDIDSAPGRGTALLARIGPPPAAGRRAGPEVGAVCLPHPGEDACGDAWAVESVNGRTLAIVVDGLGHGPQAATAAQEALRAFRTHAARGPAEVIGQAHAALRSTRGAAMAVAEVDPGRRLLRFAGIGNVAGTVVGPGGPHGLVSHNGTVGHAVRKVQEFEHEWGPGALLILHSDGVATHWRLDRYPGLIGRHPTLIAGVLYRDFRRGRDDATVLVLREEGGGRP
jgi:anti-sigma regulatory factor (Ser/Thr protein kinase)